MIRRFMLGCLLTVCASGVGCVSSRAGYQKAEDLLYARTGVRVRSQRLEESDTSNTVGQLLGRPLTADSSAKIALLQSPEVQAALDRIGVARGNLISAVRLPNPRVDGVIRFRPDKKPDLGVDAVINVIDLVFLPVRENAASTRLDAASLEAAGTAMDVAFEARTAFYDYVSAEQSLELAKSVVVASDAGADLAKRLADAGNIPDLNAINEDSLYAESRLSLQEAESQLSTARERLNAALGVWGDQGQSWSAPVRLDEPPATDPPLDDAERIAIDKSLDLAITKLRFSAAASDANLGRAQGIIPQVDVGVDAERDPDGWGVGPRVGIAIPLFYQGQGAVDAGRAEMNRQRHLQNGIATQIRSEARALAMRVRNAHEAAVFYKETLLPLRQKLVAQTQLHYNAMGVSAFELLAAKRMQVDTARGYVGALREYWTARAALELLLSGRLTRPLAHDFGLGVRSGGTSGD